MTPAEAFDATRDTFVSLLSAHARADGVEISTGQIYGMLDTALERAGLKTLIGVVAAADVAALGYADTYETPPAAVAEADTAWHTARDRLADYPNLAGLISPP